VIAMAGHDYLDPNFWIFESYSSRNGQSSF
jgi:hypothetical protein